MDDNSNSNSNAKIVDGEAVKSSTQGQDTCVTAPNPNSQNSNSNSSDVGDGEGPQSSRTPFTNLSQVDADLALARTLQDQERAYMMLSMNGGGVGYGSWETGVYIPDHQDDDDDDFGDSNEDGYEVVDEDEDDDENDADMEHYNDENQNEDHAHHDSGDSDDHHVQLDPSAYPDDEAYARALQDAEERDMAARLLAMAAITEREIVDVEEHENNSQGAWASDPDELSYEELIALGEVVGTESRGLSADTIASLPSTNYNSLGIKGTESDPCVICRVDYEDGDPLTTLPCKHAYHSECINNWLKLKKACPVCSTEVSTSTSGNS